MTRPSKVLNKKLPQQIMDALPIPLPDKKRGKIDVEQALKMRCVNSNTYQEIADYFGVSKQSIHEALQPYGCGEIDLKTYKTHRADIFVMQEGRLLTSLTDDDIKAISADKRVWAAKNLQEMQRLESGLSTANNQHLHLHASFHPIPDTVKIVTVDDEI